jgi:radical SAM superfamily enzyme YgiQ (UPF0313 family)
MTEQALALLHMHALLISTYEMGRQPFGLASPAAWLRAAGWAVTCVDVTKERLQDEVVSGIDLIGFHLPMHTATRLAIPIIGKARRLNPSARICAYGLYAPLNARWLRSLGVDEILDGEFEEELTAIAVQLAGLKPCATTETCATTELLTSGAGLQACDSGAGLKPSAIAEPRAPAEPRVLPRLKFLIPDRSDLPALDRYASLQLGDGRRKVVGYTEASRGCRHMCRHCPVVPVYNGQFRIVQPDIVLADIAGQVRQGAEHITFGDPDFFNGPTHAVRIVEALHKAHPMLTYDVTIKIEHLLIHRELLPRLRETGCLFVTSAVESLDDLVLARLEKGHTRRDFVEAVGVCREAGVTIVPTFVAFHPWLTLEGYCDLLDTLEALDLIDHVAPIQLAIRLLIPEGSRLLELEEVRNLVGAFDPGTLTYRWTHADRRVEDLHRDVAALVGIRLTGDRRAVFSEISQLAHDRNSLELGALGVGPQRREESSAARAVSPQPARDRATVPYLNEPWYC